MAIEFTESAAKHGISQDDALWAMTHARYVERQYDEPRLPGHQRPTLFIGPSRTPSVPLLEVKAELVPPDRAIIFHVMPAREKHLVRMEDQ